MINCRERAGRTKKDSETCGKSYWSPLCTKTQISPISFWRDLIVDTTRKDGQGASRAASPFDDVDSCSPPSETGAQWMNVFLLWSKNQTVVCSQIRVVTDLVAGRWRHAVSPLITAFDPILSSQVLASLDNMNRYLSPLLPFVVNPDCLFN